MRSLKTCLTLGLLAAVLLTAQSADGAARSAAEFSWEGALAAGQTLEIKGVNGSIRAVASSGDRAEVSATKKGRRSDPATVEIEVVEHAGGVTVCAVYPGRPGRPNTCAAGSGGRLGAHDNDVAVDFEVRVPAGRAFVGQTVNGSVKAQGLRGAATAVTVNGSISLETTSHAQATTVNGSIEATLGSSTPAQNLEFETVNGSITLVLPADLNAEVRAASVNGKVKTDFPLEVPRTWHGGKARGTLGRGGAEVAASTVNGSVTLRKSG